MTNDHIARMNMREKFIKQKKCEKSNCCRTTTRETLQTYIRLVTQWHKDRNLIEGSTDKDQTLKLMQELGELSDSVCKNKDVKDDIGDMLVVMINIAERNGISLTDCLETAWHDIKDRKGKMVDGIFVKEGD